MVESKEGTFAKLITNLNPVSTEPGGQRVTRTDLGGDRKLKGGLQACVVCEPVTDRLMGHYGHEVAGIIP